MKNLTLVLIRIEILCALLGLFGLLQVFNVMSGLEYGIMNDNNQLLIFIATIVILSALISQVLVRKDPEMKAPIHNGIQTVLTFYVVYMIFNYAFAKILKTQFQPPYYVLETPIGDLNGFWLTWTYFGFSETFSNILGITQLAGGALLLFRRTRLLGAFILLPVMINICLIDHFYKISPLAYFNALHYTFIISFFVLLDARKLVDVFFSAKETLSSNSWKFWALNAVKVAIVFLAFLKIYTMKNTFEPRTKINGVWKVESFRKGGVDKTPAERWDKVFFEWRYGCQFVYDQCAIAVRPQHGEFDIDETSASLKIRLMDGENKPKGDSLKLHYLFKSDSSMLLAGLSNTDSVTIQLRRLR